MYAVIRSGGKQYRVSPGDLLRVEKLDGEVGAQITFDNVLLVGGDDESDLDNLWCRGPASLERS